MCKPIWMHQENAVENNREMLKYFESIGYRFELNGWGYMVWFKDKFIHGAGARPRKGRHWQHAKKDGEMYLFQAVLTANEHHNKQ